MSPTLSMHATQAGIILGTAAYMSPEQAKGKSVDRRADIWACGVVLYEMLSGQRAFAGDDASETLASVLKDTPAFDALPSRTPARLRDLLARCLQKDPRTRQRDIGDVRLELDTIASGKGDAAPVALVAASPARPSLAIIAGVILVVAAIGVAIGWALSRRAARASFPTTRFIVDAPPGDDPASPQFTRDGRVVVFAAGRLYKRDLAAFSSTPIPGTAGASMPVISPDGRWVVFFADDKIKKVALAGGDPTTIAETNLDMPGACWGPANTILFSRGWATGLSSVQLDDGRITQLTEPDHKLGERAHWRPHMLPGGQQAIFTIWMAATGVTDARVGILDLKTLQHRALFPGSDATYLRSGHVLYFHAGAWHVVPFDAAAGRATGDPVTVLDDALGVAPTGGGDGQPLGVSDNGTLAYLPGPVAPKREFVWVDRAGRIESLGLPARRMIAGSLSPDGRHIALTRLEGGTFELWLDDVARKTEERPDIKGSNSRAIWDPRGGAIAFISERKGEFDIYTANADGSNVQPLLTKDWDEQPLGWTHDGRWLLETEWRLDGSTPANVIDLAPGSDRKAEDLALDTAAGLALSRDDQWLAFSRVTSGRSEVYAQPFRTRTTATRVSSNGGIEPFWSPAGNEIFFRHDDSLVSASFHQEGGRVVIGNETPLFRLPSSSVICGMAPDGRLLVARPSDPPQPPGFRIVLNWFEELKGLGPGK
jgi:serine/threonine-protein kinase